MSATEQQQNDRHSTAAINRFNWTEIEGGVTAPAGFRASGLPCGIRAKRPDLALIVADDVASAAGVFTTNTLAAAPVVLCRDLLADSGNRARGVVVNAGNANACTGETGMANARRMVEETAAALGVETCHVLVASTGVIGQQLPIEKVSAGIPQVVAALRPDGSSAASDAILTTDNGPKTIAVEVDGPFGSFRVGGIAKGAGMINPSMATTLAFVTTDAPIAPTDLAATLRGVADRTFNCISVDGETSTNDAIIALAHGRDGLDAARFAAGSEGLEAFAAALEHVLLTLAKMIVADGEGATKVMAITVTGARTPDEALKAARAINNSLLVKTAVHGADANWGRIASTVGATGVGMVPERLSIRICGLPVLEPGFVSRVDEAEAKKRMSQAEIPIEVDLAIGEATARVWGCDLSAEYIRINADYRS